MRKKIIKRGILLTVSLVFIVFISVIFYKTKFTRPISIIYIPKIEDSSNDFWTTLISGAKMAAEEYDIHLEVWSPASETDVDGQNALIKKAAKKEPDVLAISPISYSGSTELLSSVTKEKKLPLVLIDSDISKKIYSSLISSDNIEIGKKMGKYTKTFLNDNSEIAIVSHVKNSSTALQREQGFNEALGNQSSKIVETVYSNSNFETAYQVTLDLINRHPNISLIAGMNEYSAVGAGNAIRDLGLADRVKIIGVDNSIAAIRFLETGIFSGLVTQKPFNMGYLGIQSAYQIATGKHVEASINSGCELITQQNMYTEQGQKLLFSFMDK